MTGETMPGATAGGQHPDASADPASGNGPSPRWYRQPIAWFWHKQDSSSRGNGWARSIWAVFLLLGGFAINEGYAYVRSSFVDPDAYLKKIEAKQDASFQALQDSLGRLSGSMNGTDRAVVREVQAAAGEIKNANRGLMQQLALAKRENERLAKLAGQQVGVQGGYDFILSGNTGLALDEGVVLGVTGVGTNVVYANLSTPEAPNRAARLRSGQSLAYRSANGRNCSVTVLSIQQGASASFSTHCG